MLAAINNEFEFEKTSFSSKIISHSFNEKFENSNTVYEYDLIYLIFFLVN